MSLFGASYLLQVALARPAQPNLVFILADDLGYNELGFTNASRGIHSPHLDCLARQGVILKNYYVQPICSPTRSALMTGRVPLRLGMQSNVIIADTPWAVDLGETFLPQNLQDAGYDTAMFGKWHLGMFRQSAWPTARGFQEHMGYMQGCSSKATHITTCCQAGEPTGDLSYVCPARKKGPGSSRGYDWFKSGGGHRSQADPSANETSSAKLIGDAAVEYIQRKAGGPKPFFLYLPFQNIHKPYTVEQRFRAIYSQRTDITEEEVTMWGYISEMDEQVGRVVSTVKATGIYTNTIIVFSSDNGAPDVEGVSHEEEIVPGLGDEWSRRNFPFRGRKGQIWEGGVRVPAFVHYWMLPDEIKGTESQALLHITDWLPTLVSLAGGSTRRNRPLDGFNIWPAILGNPNPRHEMLYNVNPLQSSIGTPPAGGIRIGDWKLLVYSYQVNGVNGSNMTGPDSWGPADFVDGLALYNLAEDPRETSNVVRERPELVLRMLETW